MFVLAIRDAIANFLNIVLFENSFIFFNLWSIVHLVLGFFVMLFLIKKFRMSFRNSFSVFFILLILWEIFEFAFYSQSDAVFRAETRLDVLWDIIQGMIGGAFCFGLNRDELKRKL
ncbi:MAG: hypothetical protein MUF61_03330, partial [archaeon]|nr:hypothetical protein [archaeon]